MEINRSTSNTHTAPCQSWIQLNDTITPPHCTPPGGMQGAPVPRRAAQSRPGHHRARHGTARHAMTVHSQLVAQIISLIPTSTIIPYTTPSGQGIVYVCVTLSDMIWVALTKRNATHTQMFSHSLFLFIYLTLISHNFSGCTEHILKQLRTWITIPRHQMKALTDIALHNNNNNNNFLTKDEV